MPQDLLKLIQALETYRAEQSAEKKMPDNLTVGEFIEMMSQVFSSDEPEETPAPPPAKFQQHQGSYKILSLDGTLTAMDIASTDLVQVTSDSIKLIWPRNHIEFSTVADKSRASIISQEEFRKLAEFVSQ
jgi:hypothetical protein